jgi:hypothetical protein
MRVPAAMVAALVVAPAAAGSVFIGNGVAHPRLAVDAKGNALVTWVGGAFLVPAAGQLTHGGGLAGPDVSRPAPGRVPLALTVRRAGALLYALQQWQVQPNGPLELHLARWRGPLPQLRLVLDGERLTGTSPYRGSSTTLEGKRVRVYVYLDVYAANGWKRMLGVSPKADGTFAVFLRPEWAGKRYRATVAGPGYAPDMQVEIAAP